MYGPLLVGACVAVVVRSREVSAHGRSVLYCTVAIENTVGTRTLVHYLVGVHYWECPLLEVPLYIHVRHDAMPCGPVTLRITFLLLTLLRSSSLCAMYFAFFSVNYSFLIHECLYWIHFALK